MTDLEQQRLEASERLAAIESKIRRRGSAPVPVHPLYDVVYPGDSLRDAPVAYILEFDQKLYGPFASRPEAWAVAGDLVLLADPNVIVESMVKPIYAPPEE